MNGEQTLEPEVVAYLRPDDYIDRNYAVKWSCREYQCFCGVF